jgi:hypothetical protein
MQKIDLEVFKKMIMEYSSDYFYLYHSITLEIEVCRLDQISNFYSSTLVILKEIYESDNRIENKGLAAAISKLGRLINEIVLLQYKTKIRKDLLIKFLERSNELIDYLESQKKSPDKIEV